MTIPAPHPATRPRLQQGVGVGRARTRAGLGRGCWALLAPAPGVAICPQGPQEPVSLTVVQACSSGPLGVSSVLTAAQASGRGLWWSRGSSGRAGLLLPAAGPASTPLRVGPEQGSQGAVGWGASTLHLEVSSQGCFLARSPLRGGLGIWKESRRVGSRRGLRSPQSPFTSSPASQGTSVPSEGGTKQLPVSSPHAFIPSLICSSIYSFIQSPTHSSTYSPFTHSFILQTMLTRARFHALQRSQREI